MDNGNGWWWVLGIVGLFIVIALVVVVVLAFGQNSKTHSDAPSPSRKTADDLLSERFARGEIDEAEYRRRRDALRE